MEAFLQAILDDDRSGVNERLKKEPALATRRVDAAKLYESTIVHWLYVGDTGLHLAAAGYRVEIARSLLAAGADANAATNHRRSRPLHYAADGCINSAAYDATRQGQMIRCLLDAGAELHAPDKNGATPLHRAVRTRCAAAVEGLLDAGADPTVQNNAGSTPFHLAVQHTGRGGTGTHKAKAAQRQIIEALRAAGVSPHVKDARGKSVSDWAKSEWIRHRLSGRAV